jgi:hypothetical protein
MKFLVILGAFVVLCAAKPSKDLMNVSGVDGESMEATNWSYVVGTDKDIEAMRATKSLKMRQTLNLLKKMAI